MNRKSLWSCPSTGPHQTRCYCALSPPVPCTQSSCLSEDCSQMRARLNATFGHVTELQIWLWPCDTVPWNGLHWDIWMMVGTAYVRLRQRLCERQIAMLLWLTAVFLYQVAGFHSPGFYYATYKKRIRCDDGHRPAHPSRPLKAFFKTNAVRREILITSRSAQFHSLLTNRLARIMKKREILQ